MTTAMGQPVKTANLHLMLWNVSGGKSEPDLPRVTVQKMEKILETVRIGRYTNLMALCTDQIVHAKHAILRKIFVCDKKITNTNAEVYHTEGITISYLEPAELQQLPVKRLSVTITTNEETGKKTLVASWHGPKRNSKEVCLHMLKGIQDLKDKHKCSAAIVGGDYNLTPDSIRKMIQTNLPHLHMEVSDDYTSPTDRPKKLDYLVYWPKWAFIITKTELVAEDFRLSDRRVFDHPIVMYSLLEWSLYDLDGDLGAPCVALRKWQIMNTGAEFIFTCSHPGMTEDKAKLIRDDTRLQLGQVYRAKGCAISQVPGSSDDPVFWPKEQLFISKPHSPLESFVQFDKDLREYAGQSDCTTVYGIFPMRGSIEIAHAMKHKTRGQNNIKLSVQAELTTDTRTTVSTQKRKNAHPVDEFNEPPKKSKRLKEITTANTKNERKSPKQQRASTPPAKTSKTESRSPKRQRASTPPAKTSENESRSPKRQQASKSPAKTSLSNSDTSSNTKQKQQDPTYTTDLKSSRPTTSKMSPGTSSKPAVLDGRSHSQQLEPSQHISKSLRDRLSDPHRNTVVLKAVFVSREGKEEMVCESDDLVFILEFIADKKQWKPAGCFKKHRKEIRGKLIKEYAHLLHVNDHVDNKLYAEQLKLAKDTLDRHVRRLLESP